jgi:hypothetical protein
MKLEGGKWITIGVKAVPETRIMLDKLSKHENKKIKPLFEDMLVSYIQQKYNEKIQPVEAIDADMRNTKQIIGEISSSLEYQKDDRERKMMQSRIDTFERYYGVLLARKNCCLEEATAYQNILKGDNVKE